MEKIDFSAENFNGFESDEDLLVDSGIFLAYFNAYDKWNAVVAKMLNEFVLNEELDHVPVLYFNPCIFDEVVHLTDTHKSFNTYFHRHPNESPASSDEMNTLEQNTISSIKTMVENDLIISLNADKFTYLRQLETYKILGSADAFNVSLVNECGISFVTVDNRLVNNIEQNIKYFPNIEKIYYAPPQK